MDILLVVDVQNDFCTGGSLAVQGSDEIIPKINALMKSKKFDLIIATQDWHPANHVSFASTHNQQPFSTKDEKVLWPDHCVQNTHGAEFHPELKSELFDAIVRKGAKIDVDSFSAIWNEKGDPENGLFQLLSDDCIGTVYIVGIATDYCVKQNALDINCLANVCVIKNACAGVSNETTESAYEEMKKNGVTFWE